MANGNGVVGQKRSIPSNASNAPNHLRVSEGSWRMCILHSLVLSLEPAAWQRASRDRSNLDALDPDVRPCPEGTAVRTAYAQVRR